MSQKYLSDSELILNKDGSVYHLHLLPEDISDTIITVGDPNRVQMVSSHFDSVDLKKEYREFVTHTGTLGGKRLTVISTGIGTDNIDIVINELDALVNIDLETRMIKEEKRSLNIIRLGTSGSIQKDIEPDSILISEAAIGLDVLMHYYLPDAFLEHPLTKALSKKWPPFFPKPYFTLASSPLVDHFHKEGKTIKGITLTMPGFYAPQGRSIRYNLPYPDFYKELRLFEYGGKRLTNIEMETSGIYGLADLLGHQAVSINAILANRATGKFSYESEKTMEKTIQLALETLRSNS